MERKKKRSVFSMGDILNTLSPDGESSDKAFKLAMFNGLAILVVIVSMLTFCGVYFILEPFIKPLMWALLCGSALHPFKQVLAQKFRKGIQKLESSPRPIYLNLALVPFRLVFSWADFVGDFLLERLRLLIKFFVGLLLLTGFYFLTPNGIWRFCALLMRIFQLSQIFIIDIFNSTLIVGTIVLGFILALIFLWKPQYQNAFLTLSIIVYIAVTSWLSNFVFYLRIPLFVLFQLGLCGCYFYSIASKYLKSENKEPEEKQPENVETNKIGDGQTSFLYIRWLMIICAGVSTISISTVPYLLLFLTLIYTIKKLCFIFGITDRFNSHIDSLKESLYSWCSERKNVLIPPPLHSCLSLISKGSTNFLSGLQEYCDSVAAVAVILGLLLFGLFFSMFFMIQAYREGVYLVQAGGSIVNSTIVNNPELSQMLPEDWQSTKNTALENAYIYARDGLAQLIRNLLKGKGIDELKSAELEKGALELWDRAYEAWVKPLETNVDRSTTPDAVFNPAPILSRDLKKHRVVSWESARALIQENMSTLSAGLDSLWVILRGNMSLLISIVTTLFSLVFGGGLSVINFTLHMVVFWTALFYLLSTSRQIYKPVEMITQMSPKYGKRLALAVEQSCREVLAASTKLSLFYGLWTWLIHTFFMSNLVYVPAAFAAVLGVVPILGTYWACLPAILDLWLLQDSKIRALGLFLAQIFPTTVVETTVYNEIKGGGHPYLTGLSIAGGMFWLGIEGAIAGPLILCFVFTIANMVSSLDTDENQ